MNITTTLRTLVEAKESAYREASKVSSEQSKVYYALIDQIQAAIEMATRIENQEREAMIASQGPTWMDLV